MYVRDPSGNLVEIDWPDAESLADDVRAGIRGLEELDLAQEGEAREATLYHERAAACSGTPS